MTAGEYANENERVELESENVRERPDLSKKEKETIIRIEKGQDHAVVDSFEGSVMRNAIKHPHVEIEDHNVRDGSITSVSATLPVGLFLVKGEPRNSSGHSRVFSQPTLRETDDED